MNDYHEITCAQSSSQHDRIMSLYLSQEISMLVAQDKGDSSSVLFLQQCDAIKTAMGNVADINYNFY